MRYVSSCAADEIRFESLIRVEAVELFVFVVYVRRQKEIAYAASKVVAGDIFLENKIFFMVCAFDILYLLLYRCFHCR